MNFGRGVLRKVARLFTAPVDAGIWRRAIFRCSPNRLVYLKQYGERRTGTNFLRAILLSNYPAAYPVMHVLGDKHSSPVNLQGLLDEMRDVPDRDFEFVRRATLEAPATSTSGEAGQQIHLRRLAHPLAAAVESGRIGFLISTKHPHPWAASLVRFRKWTKEVDGRRQMDPAFAPQLVEACRTFNRNYRAWLDLYQANKDRSTLIRYEDLLEAPAKVVTRVESQFRISRLFPTLSIPKQTVAPTNWDANAPWIEKNLFRPDLYTSHRYERQLSSEMWALVTKTIDWDLMTHFGYNKAALGATTGPLSPA